MLLLGISDVDLETNIVGLSIDAGVENNDIIVNDANRSFLNYSELAALSDKDLKAKRKELSHILHYFFKRHKSFSYY